MALYVCTICGYVYDEEKVGVKFDTLNESWKCPLCGATKQQFEKKGETATDLKVVKKTIVNSLKKEEYRLSDAELNVIFTNFAKGCKKQYMEEEAALFTEIADFYKMSSKKQDTADFSNISSVINNNLSENYPQAFALAKKDGDRGALRALNWSEKTEKINKGILDRYKKEGSAFLKDAKIFVCEICGFIYIGDKSPEICPICKVPKLKIHEVGRA